MHMITFLFDCAQLHFQFGTTIIDSQAAKLYTKKVSVIAAPLPFRSIIAVPSPAKSLIRRSHREQVNGKNIERGVAFPVCVSVNDVICNHSPLGSEEVVSP